MRWGNLSNQRLLLMWQLLYDGGRLLGKLQRERNFRAE